MPRNSRNSGDSAKMAKTKGKTEKSEQARSRSKDDAAKLERCRREQSPSQQSPVVSKQRGDKMNTESKEIKFKMKLRYVQISLILLRFEPCEC